MPTADTYIMCGGRNCRRVDVLQGKHWYRRSTLWEYSLVVLFVCELQEQYFYRRSSFSSCWYVCVAGEVLFVGAAGSIGRHAAVDAL